jgi:Lipid A core - O-antigen ligase and related enzymes
MKKKTHIGLEEAVFFLLYYIYMNGVRRIMIPMSSVTVVAILMLVLFIVIYYARGKIPFFSTSDKIQGFSWGMIAVLIFLNNTSISQGLTTGGMIQLYVMICFMLFAANESDWIWKWVSWTEIFVMIHAIATIVLYFNRNLRVRFASIMFYGADLAAYLRHSEKGYACGLSSHFSSNGMILGIGILVFFEDICAQRAIDSEEKSSWKIWSRIISLICCFYAIILSSKRGPLIAIFVVISLTYIIATKKNLVKRIILLSTFYLLLFLAYRILVQRIPGLSTIAEKFSELENSSAGITNGRSGLWQLAFDMFEKNPLMGNGRGSYSIYAKRTNAISSSAHNYYLDILAELGLIGLGLYLMAFISGIVMAIRTLRKALKVGMDRCYIMALSIALEIQLFVIIYNMSATALMYYQILIPYFIACTVPKAITNKGIKRSGG